MSLRRAEVSDAHGMALPARQVWHTAESAALAPCRAAEICRRVQRRMLPQLPPFAVAGVQRHAPLAALVKAFEPGLNGPRLQLKV